MRERSSACSTTMPTPAWSWCAGSSRGCWPRKLVDLLIRGERKELDVAVIAREALEELRRLVVPAALGVRALHLDELLAEELTEELYGHLAAVFQRAFRRADPLPDLRARDLCGGRVFHQVVNRHAAVAGEPGAEVLDAN